MLDYPLKFNPIFKQRIWGGEKLKHLLNKPCSLPNIGESWEISGIEGEVSVVANGSFKGQTLAQLLADFQGDLAGNKIYREYAGQFPLLIKFIDAKKNLSVQLHPNDDLSKTRHNSFGKTEMWYILQADDNAEINIGFNKNVEKDEYLAALKNHKITDLLHFEKVKKGNSFMINTGKVHAIGAGVLLAEIQQASDITYRIFDWEREDEYGNRRELHTDLALDAIGFEKKEDFKLHYEKNINTSSKIVECPYFTTNFLPVKGTITNNYSSLDSFVIYMCVSGTARIYINKNFTEIQTGETVLIPAITKEVEIYSKGTELLEVYI